MSPFRLIIIGGCAIALMGGAYLSYSGVGGATRDLAASAASVRTGSSAASGGGGYGFFGRIK